MLAVLALQFIGLAPSSAHSVLVGSNPADGQVLPSTPKTIELDFTESVDPAMTTMTITDAGGRGFHPVLVTLLGESRIVATVPPLPDQTYRIAWRTESTDDRHVTSGVVVFSVGVASSAHASVPADPLPAWPEVLLRWLFLGCCGALVGSLLLDALGTGRRGPIPAPTRSVLLRSGSRCGGVAAVAAAALMVWQAGSLSAAARLIGSPFGRRSIALEAGVIVLIVLAQRVRRDGWRRVVGWLCVVAVVDVAVASALLGHTASSPARTALGAVHLLAAFAWFGVLALFPLLTITAALRRSVPRQDVIALLMPFGAIATASVAALVVTGLLLTGDSASTVDSLFTSVFGRLLMLKLAAALVAGLLGWRTHVLLRRHRRDVRLRALNVEGAVLVVVLLAAAALASSAPPQGLRWSPGTTVKGTPTVSAEVDGLLVAVAIGPNTPGRNFVSVDVFNSRRPAPARIGPVSVRLTGPTSTVLLPTRHESSGAWVAATDAIGAPGDWSVSVQIQRTGLAAVTASFPWRVGGHVGGPARRVLSTAPVAPFAGILAVALLGIVAIMTAARAWRAKRRSPSAQPSAPSLTAQVSVGALQEQPAKAQLVH